MNHLLRCPACGPFGIRARRRQRRHEETSLIAFHAHLAAETRRARVRLLYVTTPATAEQIRRDHGLPRLTARQHARHGGW